MFDFSHSGSVAWKAKQQQPREQMFLNFYSKKTLLKTLLLSEFVFKHKHCDVALLQTRLKITKDFKGNVYDFFLIFWGAHTENSENMI